MAKKKKLTPTAWIFKKYMLQVQIESFVELARESGLEYRTMMNHIEEPGHFRIYELRALDEILHFDAADLIYLIKGGGHEESKAAALFSGIGADNVGHRTICQPC